jgi:Ca2+-binding EF-hand superfamily protein
VQHLSHLPHELTTRPAVEEEAHKDDFMSFDKNNDGFVDAAEVRNNFPKISEEGLTCSAP